MRRWGCALLALTLMISACNGSSGTAIEDLPTLVPAAPTETPEPEPTRTPTPVPPTETPVPPTETPVPPAATPTREAEPDVPDLIVEGVFDWPPGAQTLTSAEQASVNLGVSFFNMARLAREPGEELHDAEFEALRPHLTDGPFEFISDRLTDPSFEPSWVTPGREQSHRIVSVRVVPLEQDTHAVTLCFNFATTNASRGSIESTTVFAYDSVLIGGDLGIGSFDIRGSTEPGHRECTDQEMQR